MKINFDLTEDQNLLACLNETNQTNFTADELTFSDPLPIEGVDKTSITEYNSSITVTATQTSKYQGSVRLKYRRIHLPTQWLRLTYLLNKDDPFSLAYGAESFEELSTEAKTMNDDNDLFRVYLTETWGFEETVENNKIRYDFFRRFLDDSDFRQKFLKDLIKETMVFHTENVEIEVPEDVLDFIRQAFQEAEENFVDSKYHSFAYYLMFTRMRNPEEFIYNHQKTKALMGDNQDNFPVILKPKSLDKLYYNATEDDELIIWITKPITVLDVF